MTDLTRLRTPYREEEDELLLLLIVEDVTSVLSRLADSRLDEIPSSYLFANAEADAGAAPLAGTDT